jgi:hypothetical protein
MVDTVNVIGERYAVTAFHAGLGHFSSWGVIGKWRWAIL